MVLRSKTGRSLLMSVISLLLCCSMLVSTTFAWFTDGVASGANIIIAGNLDVDVLVDGESVQNRATLFDEVALWEPGVVAYENLTVVNYGTQALRYILQINFTNATDNGYGGTLADVLKVALVEDGIPAGTSRQDALAMAGEWYDLADLERDGELRYEKESHTYGVIIWWQPSDRDNDYNMNNDRQSQPLSIDLGILLQATQLPHESDSFGDDYDSDDPHEDPGEEDPGEDDPGEEIREVYNLDELREALNEGGSIRLMENIAVEEALTVTKDVTLDLNDHKLSGDTTDAIVIIYAGNVTIQDHGGEQTGAIVNTGSGTAAYVDGSASMVSAMSLADGEEETQTVSAPVLTLESGSLQAGEHGLLAVGATVIITNGTVTGKHGISARYGNIIISGGKLIGTGYGLQAIGATVTITHGSVQGTEGGLYMDGANVHIQGGEMTGTDHGMVVKDAHVKITGGILTGGVSKDESEVTITGGHFTDDTELKNAGVPYQSYEMDGKTYYVVGGKTEVTTVEQLNAAVSTCGLIVLQADLYLSEPLQDITADLVIDLNGHSIYLPDDDDGTYMTVRGARVAIIDSVGTAFVGADHNDTRIWVYDGVLMIGGGYYHHLPSPFIELENSSLYIYDLYFEGGLDIGGDHDSVFITGGTYHGGFLEQEMWFLDQDVYTLYVTDNEELQVVKIPVVTTQEELKNALGRYYKIVLGADIQTDETLTMYMPDNRFHVKQVLDLNGHTLSGSMEGPVLELKTDDDWATIELVDSVGNGQICNTGLGTGLRVGAEGEARVYVEVAGVAYGIYADGCKLLEIYADVTAEGCAIYATGANVGVNGATVTANDYGIYTVNGGSVGVWSTVITADTKTYTDDTSSVTGDLDYVPGTTITGTLTDTVSDGDRVLIYSPAGMETLGIAVSDNKLSGVFAGPESGDTMTVENAYAWTVSIDANGYYTFRFDDGRYLTSGDTGNSLYLADEASDYSLWVLEETDGGFYIKNANAAYRGNPQYLEYYAGFKTYGMNTIGDYLFRLYLVQE